MLCDTNMITGNCSALYVIDLVRFRQLAAGDRLRGQYQVLTYTLTCKFFSLATIDA